MISINVLLVHLELLPNFHDENTATSLSLAFRLGHPSSGKIDIVNKIVPFVKCNKIAHREICPVAKQKRLSFSSSTHVSDLPFDLIHCDLWGPFSTPTMDGYKYFLTIFS